LQKTAGPPNAGPVAIATFATIVNPALGVRTIRFQDKQFYNKSSAFQKLAKFS